MDEFQTQVGYALLIPFILQWLKKQDWFKLLNFHTGKLNAVVSAVVAILAALGIAVHFDTVQGVLTITGLTTVGLFGGLQHSFLQFLMQHAAYRALIAPPKPGIEQAIARDQGH